MSHEKTRPHLLGRRRSGGHAPQKIETVAVLGLGRFGTALALELEAQGVEVLGVDFVEETVQELSERLSYAVRADVARAEVLDQLGVIDADRVVVAAGGRIETSVLACSHLLRAGVRDLWAKADSDSHSLILNQLGVHHVISPEKAMGKRVAHLLAGEAHDWVEYGHGFAMSRFEVPVSLMHKTAADAGVERTSNIKVIARCAGGERWEYATPQTIFEPGDDIIVAGSVKALEAFSNHHNSPSR